MFLGSMLSNSHELYCCVVRLASLPGLLTPVFVACCTNTGEGLVNLITCSDVSGHQVDVWYTYYTAVAEYCNWT